MRSGCLPVAAALIVMVATSCGGDPPRLDATSDESLKASIERVRGPLHVDRRKKFEEALAGILLSGESLFTIGADADGAKRRMRDRVHGKTADEVIAEFESATERIRGEAAARRLQDRRDAIDRARARLDSAQKRLDDLAAKKANAAAAKLKLSESVLVTNTRVSRGSLGDVVLDFTVENRLETPIKTIDAECAVTSPGRSIPWVEAGIHYEIAGGIEPRERRALSGSPTRLNSAWRGLPDDRRDLDIVITPTAAIGADGPLLDGRWTKSEEEALRSAESDVAEARKTAETEASK